MKKVDDYSFGRCEICGRMGALKNGKCSDCRIEMPEFLSNLFKKTGD